MNDFRHNAVNHSAGKYVRGQARTNGMDMNRHRFPYVERVR